MMRSHISAQLTPIVFLVTMAAILTTTVILSLPASLPEHHIIKTRSRQYCGTALMEMMQFICHGEYFSPMNAKRNGLKHDDQNNENQHDNGLSPFWDDSTANVRYKAPSEDNGQFLEPKRAFSLIGGSVDPSGSSHFRRNIRGLSHECCDKPCTFKELSSYCAQPIEDDVSVEKRSTKDDVSIEKRSTKGLLFESLFGRD